MFDDDLTPIEIASIINANKANVDYIEKWAQSVDPRCHFKIGSIGFGRSCVGILESSTDCYVSYQNWESDEPGFPPPASVENAYHKGPYMAVLVRDSDYNRAIAELYLWVQFYEEEKLKFNLAIEPRQTMTGREPLLVRK